MGDVNTATTEMLHGSAAEVAPKLLGWTLSTRIGAELTTVRLTEVEAYMGDQDEASHAYRGETPRNRSMFGPAGTLYVYRSYGIHWCMNIVTGPPGVPHAILLRGGSPLLGREVMAERRGRSDHLTDGPGKLCQALGVTRDHDGTSVSDGPVRLVPDLLPDGMRIATTPRIGITKAADRLWRFVAVRD